MAEEGAGSGIFKVAESGKNRENYATLHNILQPKKRKEAGGNKIEWEPGLKGYGKWEDYTPPPHKLQSISKTGQLFWFSFLPLGSWNFVINSPPSSQFSSQSNLSVPVTPHFGFTSNFVVIGN